MKTRTTLRLQHKTVGYMHYLMRSGLASTAHGVVDKLMEGYIQQYAKINNLDINEINKEAMKLYELTRRPKTYGDRANIKDIMEGVINEKTTD